jgi:hypothetical protein
MREAKRQQHPIYLNKKATCAMHYWKTEYS